jgi:ATP-dependent DNA helicase RecG
MSNLFQKNIAELHHLSEEKISALTRLNLKTVGNILCFCPRAYKLKKHNPNLETLNPIKDEVILFGIITNIQDLYKRSLRLDFEYQNTIIELIFFSTPPTFIKQTIKIGGRYIIEGSIRKTSDNKWQIAHPNFVFNKNNIAIIEPVYNLTYQISNFAIANLVKLAYQMLTLEPIKEHNPLAEKHAWPTLKDAIKALHAIGATGNIEDKVLLAKQRLASDELIAHHLNLHQTQKQKRTKEISFPVAKELKKQLLALLPFDLTNEQIQVLSEIEKSQQKKTQMIKLLQGDVGSGKTIVALVSMLNVIAKKTQAVLMAPTELLARQHYKYTQELMEPMNITCEMLISSLSTKEKKAALEKIADGTAHIIIGTHSLFQDKVKFHNLGYIVIDEQHRFGVMQRLELINKSKHAADILLMSATPIPRSLMMAFFGNIDIIQLKNTIKQRKKITTCTVPNTEEEKVLNFIRKTLIKVEKVYWICPLIDEIADNSLELIDEIATVNFRSAQLEKHFEQNVCIIHGKMKTEEKEMQMQKFLNGSKNILVATTIVEVGIHVPDATLIVIENAEKFGLAQLHQLRGRVGRSQMQSYCILVYNKDKLTDISIKRLKAIKNIDDGFLIAKEDLKIRGAGNVLGTKQSGKQDFYFADQIEYEENILEEIADYAKRLSYDAEAIKFYSDLFPFNQNITIS